MPDEVDDIGAPPSPRLCPDHRPVVRSLTRMDHIGDEDSARVAKSIAEQCPQCRSER